MKSILIYRLDSLLGILSVIAKIGMNLIVITFLFRFLTSIGGWTLDQIVFLYGFSTTSFGIWHCLFVDTTLLPVYINTGALDRVLLTPVNPIFQISMNSFTPDGWIQLGFGIVLISIAVFRLGLLGWPLLTLPVLLASSSLIYMSISLAGSAISFFTVGNTNLANLVMDCHEFTKYPLTIYGTFLKALFTTIIPIGFVAYYPSIFYMTDSGLAFLIITPVVSIFVFVLACILWLRMLNRYVSSGH